MEKIITGNVYNKYNTENIIFKKLMNNFTVNLLNCINDQKPLKILEVGCGEGLLAAIICENIQISSYEGFDIEEDITNKAKTNCPIGKFSVSSVYDMDRYESTSYNYLIMSEVLEHLENPEKALELIASLDIEKFIFSVPNEPIWRILNMARLSYLKNFGNTPGHIQHWSKSDFKKLISRYFQIIEAKSVFPWTMMLCKKL